MNNKILVDKDPRAFQAFMTSKTSAAFFCLTTKVKPTVRLYIHLCQSCHMTLYITSGHVNGSLRETSQQAPPLADWPNLFFEGSLENLQSSGSVPHRATLIQNLCETYCSRLSTFAAFATSFLRPILFLHSLPAPTLSTIGMLESVPRISRRTSVVIEGLCW